MRSGAARDRPHRRHRQRQDGRRRRVCGDGRPVTDTDALAHALTAPGAPGYEAVLEAFGAGFPKPDGTLDRAALRRHVFADDRGADAARVDPPPADPRGRAAGDRRAGTVPTACSWFRSSSSAAGAPSVDRVLVVDCPEDEQVRRVMARSGLAAGRGARDHGHATVPCRSARASRRRARQRGGDGGDRAAGRGARSPLPGPGRGEREGSCTAAR